MSDEKGGMSCSTMCWIAGALLGFAAFLLINQPWLVAIIVGVVLAVALGFGLQKLFCSDMPVAGGATVEVPTDTVDDQPPHHDETAKPAAAAEPYTDAAAMAEVTTTEESETVAIEGKDEPQSKPAMAPEAPAAPAPAVAPAPAAAGDGAKPALLDAPDGAADDLKMIKGVGPQLEKKLNDLGVYHFAQIADWDAAQVAWVDDQLKFRGRIMRDDWIAQAKTLAAGGSTEFASRAKSTGKYEA